MLEYKSGNLLDAPVDFIVHGCNCHHTMGGGIAYQISQRYPEAMRSDRLTPHGDVEKLGTYSIAMTPQTSERNVCIINAYTQFHPGRDVSYDAIEKVFMAISENISTDAVIGMPRIGCGIAGGDWNRVEELINKHLSHNNIVVYDYGRPDWVLDGDTWVENK